MTDLKPTAYRVSDDPIIRFCAFYFLLYLGGLILGRFGIFLIVLGLTFFFTRVLARTPSGQMYIRSFFVFKDPKPIVAQTHSRLYKIIITSVRLILFGLYTYGSMILIWLGIKFLLNNGFLNQNLIYILFFKFR